MTLAEKKYQLISSILTLNRLDDLNQIEQLVYSIPKSNSTINQLTLNDFHEMINDGLQDHKSGKVFTSKELLDELRLQP